VGEKAAVVIVYTCFSGTLAALVAANLHLGKLSSAKYPAWQELLSLPYFNQRIKRGRLLFVGKDPCGHCVYVAAVGPYGRLVRQIVRSFLQIWGLPEQQVMLVDAGEKASSLLLLGCLLKAPKLIHWGLKKSYQRLCRLVEEVAVLKLDVTGKILDNGGEK
jgi:hypothetical protein